MHGPYPWTARVNAPLEVSIHQTKEILDSETSDYFLLDCRRPEEFEIARLDTATLIPMDELPSRVVELDPHRDKHILVYCHAGVRSAMVAQWLRQNGFPRAQSVAGGIDAWSVQIDPSVPRY